MKRKLWLQSAPVVFASSRLLAILIVSVK